MGEPGIEQDEIDARLYLIGPAETPPGDLFSDRLAAVLEAVRPVAFLLPISFGRDHAATSALRQLCAKHDTAFLVQNDPVLATNLAADGLHQSDVASIKKTRTVLTKDQILGADTKRSRHDAMEAGENGADYVAFGQFGDLVDDELVDIVAWWRDLFVLPCLTYADTLDDAARLADTGADFIGVSAAIWDHSDGPVAGARHMQAAIGKN